ncbi:hypothetical protein BDZ89DRAFT_1073301 [Hymenopellis radicata]|nr:hypothetical protein BDZ89DRAFT_1073301 [Hymenopellis radicata]
MSTQQDVGVDGWAAYHPYDLSYDYPYYPGTAITTGASHYDASESSSVSGTSTTPGGPCSSGGEGDEIQKQIQALQLQVYVHQQSAEVNQKCASYPLDYACKGA